jgi:hypothetical protein
MAEDRKCAHPGCVCLAEPGSDYCSTECQKANSSENRCTCHHEVCQQEQQLPKGGKRDGSYDPAMPEAVKKKPLMDDWGESDKH